MDRNAFSVLRVYFSYVVFFADLRLIHHLRHLHSPCLLVTCHSAQFFPSILIPDEEPVTSPADNSDHSCEEQSLGKMNQSPQRFSSRPRDLDGNMSSANGGAGAEQNRRESEAAPSDSMEEFVKRCPTAFPVAALRPLRFDCVLCDVPCSADGTLRKARSLWSRWHSNQGLGCHRLQLQILLR